MINVSQMMEFVFDRAFQNIVGKGDNAGYQHRSVSHTVFEKVSLKGSLKIMTV